MFKKLKRFSYNAYIYSAKKTVIEECNIPELKHFTNALQPIEKSGESKTDSGPDSGPEDSGVDDEESSNEASNEASESIHALTKSTQTEKVQEPVAENVQDEAGDFSKSVDVSSPLFTGNISGSQGEAGLPEKPGAR